MLPVFKVQNFWLPFNQFEVRLKGNNTLFKAISIYFTKEQSENAQKGRDAKMTVLNLFVLHILVFQDRPNMGA